jgi:lipopolysaccharide transport system ATP-binding protein
MQLQDSAVIGFLGEEPAAGAGNFIRVTQQSALEKARLEAEIFSRRARGELVRVFSNDEDFLMRVCDEIQWLRDGAPVAKGDPREVIGDYRHWVARTIREEAQGRQAPLAPSMRRGDGRAEIEAIDTLGADGRPALTWSSGENVCVRVRVRFHREVADPVVGIMVRTRIGMEVYGTNTELERLKLGPAAAGAERVVRFEFACLLCPQEYTITAASHDPDGVWHDWLEDAVAIRVTDSRYTAGVANLRARVSVED